MKRTSLLSAMRPDSWEDHPLYWMDDDELDDILTEPQAEEIAEQEFRERGYEPSCQEMADRVYELLREDEARRNQGAEDHGY